nr:M28 family peptidase [Candidatus Sigynarchaeota archaeon]
MAELVTDDDIDYAHGMIKTICTEIGPGCPCSPQERSRAMKVKEEMEKSVDSVNVEEFTCAPDAYIGWFRLGAILATTAMVCFYISLVPGDAVLFSTIAFAVSIFIIVLFICQFVLTARIFDFMFPKRQSLNIVGKFNTSSTGAPKRIIIFSGHHDSAMVYTWFQYLKGGYYIAIAFLMLGILFLAAMLSIRLFSLLGGVQLDWIVSTLIFSTWTIFPVTIVVAIFFTGSGKNGGSVPGASDNLAAVSICLAIGRIVKRHPELIPVDTEIRLVTFGCEEAGERGSYAYVTSHLAELRAADAVVVNFESICRAEMRVFTSDMNNFVKNDPSVVALIAEAAKVAGVPCDVKPFWFGGGGTDALPFSKMHIKAASLFSMKVPQQMIEFYHQKWDNYDKVPKEALSNALKIAVAFLQRFK